jgi:formate-dependent nitrite reductase cytochrome c552 subunit
VTLSKPTFFLVAATAVAAMAGAGWWIYQRSFAGWERAKAASKQVAAAPAPTDKAKFNRVEIHPGPATPVVLARHTTTAGNVAAVACSTCHTTRVPNVAITQAAQLKEFHLGLTYRHGELSCLSCHNATNYDTLRRADGTTLAYPQTMLLCAQCHGPTYRDYLHGSHGGMNGYWDLKRGPRERNTCTDCHDPHAPLYPKVLPVFPPRDRGAQQQQARMHTNH